MVYLVLFHSMLSYCLVLWDDVLDIDSHNLKGTKDMSTSRCISKAENREHCQTTFIQEKV